MDERANARSRALVVKEDRDITIMQRVTWYAIRGPLRRQRSPIRTSPRKILDALLVRSHKAKWITGLGWR